MKEEIGKIFKNSLQNERASVDPEEWDELAIKLDRMRFYRFSFSHFNIYYCGMLLFCFLSSVFVVGKIAFLKESNEWKKSDFSEAETKEPKLDSLATYSARENLQTKSVNNHHEKVEDKMNIHDVVKDIDPSNKTDSVITDSGNQTFHEDSSHIQKTSEIKKPVVKRIKKVVKIIKQDTIMVLDTLEKKKSKRKE